MSPALTPVRDKVHAVEVARPEPGPGNFCLTPTIEAEATPGGDRAIIDCVKSIAEAMELIEKRSAA